MYAAVPPCLHTHAHRLHWWPATSAGQNAGRTKLLIRVWHVRLEQEGGKSSRQFSAGTRAGGYTSRKRRVFCPDLYRRSGGPERRKYIFTCGPSAGGHPLRTTHVCCERQAHGNECPTHTHAYHTTNRLRLVSRRFVARMCGAEAEEADGSCRLRNTENTLVLGGEEGK